MAVKVYHIEGLRHCAVVFADTAEEAVSQAIHQGVVGNWEAPEAVEVPLPPGYRFIYDRLEGHMKQVELSIPVTEVVNVKPYTVTASGVRVYDHWQDNITVDADAPGVVWKASSQAFGSHTDVPGGRAWRVRTVKKHYRGTCSAHWKKPTSYRSSLGR